MATAMGKPGTNWKQVTPANRKKVNPLVRYYMKQAHPWQACVNDNTKRFGAERAKRVCSVVKDMGERTTKWRKGGKGKVRESGEVASFPDSNLDVDAYVEAVFDSEWAPVLDAEGVTVEELADWAQMAADAGVLEAVTFDDPAEVQEAAGKAGISHATRRPGESLGDYGSRLKAGDRALERKAKTPKPKTSTTPRSADFEKQHPRGRGGSWVIKQGSNGANVRDVQRKVGAKADGKFGPRTEAAVRAFQRSRGLQVDGVVGRQTMAEFAKRGAGKSVKPGKIRGRVRQAALEGVTFRPSELVEAARELSEDA